MGKSRPVANYGNVPTTLLFLHHLLCEARGLDEEGIFRVQPSRSECSSVKQALCEGTCREVCNPHLAANLIKVWFRELTPNLLNVFAEAQLGIAAEGGAAKVAALMDELPPDSVHRCTLRWLLAVVVAVTESPDTKMSAHGMGACVFAARSAHSRSPFKHTRCII